MKEGSGPPLKEAE